MIIIQNGKEISAIIVTDDYLCYKEPKNPNNFFLILIFKELFEFETSEELQHWKTETILRTVRASTFSLRSHKDPFSFFTALPRRSDQKISMKSYLILPKLRRTRKTFLKLILRHEQNRTRNTFSEKTIKFRLHNVYTFFGPFNHPRRLLRGWHLFPFHPVENLYQ